MDHRPDGGLVFRLTQIRRLLAPALIAIVVIGALAAAVQFSRPEPAKPGRAVGPVGPVPKASVDATVPAQLSTATFGMG